MAIRIHFEDQGQDFLCWDLEALGEGVYRVVGSDMQAWVWKGYYILEGIEVGKKVKICKSLEGLPRFPILTLNYAITKIDLKIKGVMA